MTIRAASVPLLLIPLAFSSCKKEPANDSQASKRTSDTRPAASLEHVPLFDGQSAFRILKAQVSFGPRVPGSSAHERCMSYLLSELRKHADAVTPQEFQGTDGSKRYQLNNIIASFNLPATDRVLLCAHWDSRPWADQDPLPANRKKPVPGANDGASGVAVLLELARLFHGQKPPVGVDIVLFDGEDLGHGGDFSGYAQGSKYFAEHKGQSFNPRFGILLDMVGKKDISIPREQNSTSYAPSVVDYVWSLAARLASSGRIDPRSFTDAPGPSVYDDHVPLNQAGIPAIDLIDFDYPPWHTVNDTPDKCSPQSLASVGNLLAAVVYTLPQVVQ